MSSIQNNHTNKKLSYKLDKYVSTNQSNLFNNLKSLNPPTVNDRKNTKVNDKVIKEKEDGFSIYLLGANEERINNTRKKEQIEKNKIRSNNNSRSTATRKKWEDYQWKDKSSFEKLDDKYEGKSNENNSKNKQSVKGEGFDYKIKSKLILDNNKSNNSICVANTATKNLVSKGSINNIHSMIIDINKMNFNLNNKLGAIVESPGGNISQITSSNKRCRNAWGQPKYNLGIIYPEQSASVEPSNEHSHGTKNFENISQAMSIKKNSIGSIGSVDNIDEMENLENLEKDVISININRLDTVGSNIKEPNELNLSNNNSINSNNIGNFLKLSSASFKFTKDPLSPQRSINKEQDKGKDRGKSLKPSSFNYNYWGKDRESINNSIDLNNKKEIFLLENVDNSDLLNFSNNIDENQLANLKSQVSLINFQNPKNIKKKNSSNIDNMKSTSNARVIKSKDVLSPNKKPKAGYSKNNNKQLNKNKLIAVERPFSSIINFSKLKSMNNNIINNAANLANFGGNELIKSAAKNNLSDNIFNANKMNMKQIDQISDTNMPSIQFIYKSPQNKGKSQRPLSHIQKAKTNIPSTSVKNTMVPNINKYQNYNKVEERFSSRDHMPSFGNDVDLTTNVNNYSGTVNNNKKKYHPNFPITSNIQQTKSRLSANNAKSVSNVASGVSYSLPSNSNSNNIGISKGNISPNNSSQNNTSTHFKKKYDILSKIEQMDENKLIKLAKVVEELAKNENQEDKLKNSKSTGNNNSTKEIDNVFFNNFKDIFNINYIKADSVNFGNININLNKNSHDDASKLSKGDKRSSKIFDEELNNLLYDDTSPSTRLKNVDINMKKNSFGGGAGSTTVNTYKTKRGQNASPISMISIVILSTWGNLEKLGITEIQIFDNKNKKIEIIECHAFNGQDDGINKIYNNKFHTIDENDMWITSCNLSANSSVKLEIYFEAELEVENLVIWNFNGRDLTKGIKDIEIYRKNNFSWRGVVNKGSYNLKTYYSTRVNLEKVCGSPSGEKFNFELTNLIVDSLIQEKGIEIKSPSRKKNINLNSYDKLNNLNSLNSLNTLNTSNTLNNANIINNKLKKNSDSKLLREELISQEEENFKNSLIQGKSNSGNRKDIGAITIISNMSSARHTINNSLVQNENIYEKNVLKTSIGKKDGFNNFQNILNCNSQNNILSSNNFSSNYVSCNKIKLIFTSNYGDPSYIGITGLQFLDDKEEIINIEKAESIGALPKDINTAFNNCGDPRIFENIFNNLNETTDDYYMWLTPFNPVTPPYIEIVFNEQINLSAIKFWNYNKPGQIQRGARTVDLVLDQNLTSQKTIILRPGIAEDSMDYNQTILFPIVSFNFTDEELEPFRHIKSASLAYSQDYETPYLPTGFIISLKLISTWGDPNFIGLNGIEFFDQIGNSVFKYNNPRTISRPELLNESSKNNTSNNDENFINNLNIQSASNLISKIPWITSYINTNLLYVEPNVISCGNNNLDGTFSNFNSNKNDKLNANQNEEGCDYVQKSNAIYFIFDRPVSLSYIYIWNYTCNPKIGVKEIHIACDDNIIYKGYLKKAESQDNSKNITTLLFTSDINITKNIYENHLPDFSLKNKYKINENLSEQNSSFIMQLDTEEQTSSNALIE